MSIQDSLLNAVTSDKQTHTGTLLTAAFGVMSFEHWIALVGLAASLAFSLYSVSTNRKEQAKRTAILADLAETMKAQKSADASDHAKAIIRELS